MQRYDGMRLLVLMLAVTLAWRTACLARPAAGAPAARAGDEIGVRFHMYRGFDLARAIERLLVRGAIDDARALAAALAAMPAPPPVEAWARQIALVTDRAAALAAAPGLDEACRRAARLAEACAGCHAATGATPAFDAPPGAPADHPTLAARMARHRWAADRIWEGVIGNAERPWRAGLEVLATTPLPFSRLDADRTALASGLQQLASRARAEARAATSARARLYGELLVTCAACHSGRASTPR